jgi:hypothetical protein
VTTESTEVRSERSGDTDIEPAKDGLFRLRQVPKQ